MESGAISDSQISGSSEYDSFEASRYSRLHFQEKGGGWSVLISDDNQWLQIDLVTQHRSVTSVATQGRSFVHIQCVTTYKLQYGNSAGNLRYYREHGQTTDKVKYMKGPDHAMFKGLGTLVAR